MSPEQNKLLILRDRAEMLESARAYLRALGCLEVDVPLLTRAASVDAHIDLIATESGRYLHSSPEYGMKRLLAEGFGNLFQLSHVFRRGEVGELHNPEFMMAEWYRLDIAFEELIADTVGFIRLFLGDVKYEKLTYKEAFLRFVKVDPFISSERELLEVLRTAGIEPYASLESEGRDAILNLLWGTLVEPHLGLEGLTVIDSYPPTQAALAQTRMDDGQAVAERFEVYFNGVELANGYHELADPDEQYRRLRDANKQRRRLGKESLPIDFAFLQALKNHGLPDCCGVAVGFDRLLLIRHQVSSIDQVLPFSWHRA